MKQTGKTTVFIRYALSYTVVVLTLFFSIAGYLYVSTSRHARQNLIDSQINRLTRIASQHESYIFTMLNTAEQIGLSPHIEPFRYDLEPWKAYDLQLQLVPYTSTNTFCDQVYLYFSGDERIYSSSASMTVSMFSRMIAYEHITAEQLAAAIRSTDRLTILPSQRVVSSLLDDTRAVTFLIPLGANPGTSKGLLLFLVKDGVYQSLFSDAIEDNTNTYIFQDGQVLSCCEDLPFSWEERASIEKETASTFSWQGEEWTLVSLTDRNWGLSYAAVLRNADINAAVWQEIFSNLSILPLFVALCLVMALWMARRHAEPIQALTGLLPTDGKDARTDEIQQISSGIRQLTTRNMELATRLEHALPMQRHDFVFQFIKGRFSSREEAISGGRAVGLEIARPCYAVILCSGADGSDHPFELNQPPFDRLTGYSGAGVELVALKAQLYLVFFEEQDTLFSLADLIRTEGEAAGGRCITAISAVHTDFEDAPSAYLEAAAAYDNRFVMGIHKTLYYSDISSNVTDILPQAQKLTTSISQSLALGSRELLDARINDLLFFLKNTHMSPFVFRMIYNSVINTLAHTHASEMSSGANAREFYDIFSLSSCQSIDDLDDMLRRLCDLLLSGVENAEEKAKEEDEIDQVVRYMEEHFNNPEISMTAIADSFELSTTRFSLSFKERKGMPPLEYLTLLRVEHAKDLLASTDMTIRDISIQVGYYDSGSFIRRFKQVTGETPLQYRRGHDTEKSESREEAP